MSEHALGPHALGRVRLIGERIAALERARVDVFTLALEAAGHDPGALEVTAVDLATGAFVTRAVGPGAA